MSSRAAPGRLIRIALLLLAPLGLAGRALAEPGPPRGFEAAYQAGQDLFHLGRYGEAREVFERARTLAPHLPGPHRWLGRVERVLEHWEACVAASTEAVRLRPGSPLVPQVREDLDTCRTALGRPGYVQKLLPGQGALAVIADVDSAQVSVDGIPRGPTPLPPFPLNAGSHRVRVVGASGEVAERTVVVIPSIVVDVLVRKTWPK